MRFKQRELTQISTWNMANPWKHIVGGWQAKLQKLVLMPFGHMAVTDSPPRALRASEARLPLWPPYNELRPPARAKVCAVTSSPSAPSGPRVSARAFGPSKVGLRKKRRGGLPAPWSIYLSMYHHPVTSTHLYTTLAETSLYRTQNWDYLMILIYAFDRDKVF